MFEKQICKLRESIENSMIDFFGKDMTVSKAVDWESEFEKKYLIIYGNNYDSLSFKDIDSKHRKDFAKYKTIKYFLKNLVKLQELENTLRGNYD